MEDFISALSSVSNSGENDMSSWMAIASVPAAGTTGVPSVVSFLIAKTEDFIWILATVYSPMWWCLRILQVPASQGPRISSCPRQ